MLSTDLRDKYKITSLDQASRYLAYIARMEAQQAENDAAAKAECERINAFYNKQIEHLQERIDFFKEFLIAYDTERREADPKFRLKTPNGSLVRRKSKEYNWADEKKLIDWLKDHRPGLVNVKTTVSVAKADLKKTLTAIDEHGNVYDPDTGEIVPGVRVSDSTSYTVKTEEATK